MGLLVLLVAIAIACVLMYNTLVQRKEPVDKALGGISAYLLNQSMSHILEVFSDLQLDVSNWR